MFPSLSILLGDLAAHWPLIGGLLLLGAVLVLDETSLAQSWLSQPLPAGLLAGLLTGDPWLGACLGLPLQLATLGNLPVGQFFVGEIVTPLLGAIGALYLGGFSVSQLTFSTVALPEPVIGWTFLGIILASIAGDRMVRIERGVNFRFMTAGLRSLKEGRIRNLERSHYRCLMLTAVRGLLGTTFWLIVFRMLWLPPVSHLPAYLKEASGLLVLFTPAIALGSMLELRGLRRGLVWMGGGFAVTMLILLVTGGR